VGTINPIVATEREKYQQEKSSGDSPISRRLDGDKGEI
jgi:hypothetical protein